MSAPEFSRPIDRRSISAKPVRLEANERERTALAARFGLIAVHRLEAEVSLEANGETVLANGRLEADIVQSCAVKGDDLPVTLAERFAIRFVPARVIEEEEVELDAEELDEIEYTGTSFDLGEAVAQSLALAIDPYAEGPEAEAVRREQGLLEEAKAGPLAAALQALRKD